VIRWFNLAKDELLRDLALPAAGEPLTPDDACNMALAVALRGLGAVSPNPLVGAVLVDQEHRFLAAGAHEKVGSLHAEANVLKQVREQGREARLEGAILYVTLEPCAHEGRTPSCARAVAATGIRKVVYGLRDPNPLVAGKGAALLREAGVEVIEAAAAQTLKPWSAACADLAGVFLHNISTGRIFTGMKVASSLDGVVAFEGDRRVWITGDRARAYGHFLRLAYDAVAVGAGTALADNPRLDVRHPFLGGHVTCRTPRRVVFDPRGRALDALCDSPAANLIHFQSETTIWIVAGQEQIARAQERGIKVVQVPCEPSTGRFIWAEVDEALQGLGVRSVLLEGGPGLYQAVLGGNDQRTRPELQKLHLFQAPVILGDRSPAGARALRWDQGILGDPGVRHDSRQMIPLESDWGIELSFEGRSHLAQGR
jgi:diaminohydroxyphosphoribosylaminopyrimidine deaminase/5-amino-6-(5-phosphoribosylamino)uracil reductase